MILEKLNEKFTQINLFLFAKDFSYIWKFSFNKMLLPSFAIFFGAIIPLICLFIPSIATKESLDLLSNLLPSDLGFNDKQQLYHIVLNFIYPMFFVLIPLICGTGPVATLFVSERNDKTMKVLLNTKCDTKIILKTKLWCSIISALIPTICAVASFAVIVSMGAMMYQMPIDKWLYKLIALSVFSPLLMILSVLVTYLFSKNSKRPLDALLSCAYIGVALIILIMLQFTGIITLHHYAIAALCVILAILNVLLYNHCINKVSYKRLTNE